MNARAAMVDHEARAEAAYTAMYDAAPHNVKGCYEDACFYLAQAIRIATQLGLIEEALRLEKRREQIEAVYDHQFRYVGR
jgi:hypothetical protein